ncbi:hypothetical protein [Streptomyces luteogriseus]|uniref:hypothetical protein n=1 Tax=Streptomyces luteogriseus TaxID=68233 RepID=UPI0037A7785D
MTNSPADGVPDRDGPSALVRLPGARRRTVIGPVVREGAVVLDAMASAHEDEMASAHEPPLGRGAEVLPVTEEYPREPAYARGVRPTAPDAPRRTPCASARTSSATS